MVLPYLLLISKFPYWKVGFLSFFILSILHFTFEINTISTPIELRRMIINFIINFVLCFTFTFISVKYHRLFKSLYILSVTDSLTSVFNRRQFDIYIKEFIRLRKPDEALALVIFDIDHFKHINDTCGHPFGDVILTNFTKIINKSIRTSDHLFRVGGEEFALLLPGTNKQIAKEVAERIRREVKQQIFISPTGQQVQITISGGVIEYHNETAKTFYEKADKQLYQAKKNGRDTIR
jgi:diguanylate cyclase (GGDEF)-like protein